jgi:hypothetical protein
VIFLETVLNFFVNCFLGIFLMDLGFCFLGCSGLQHEKQKFKDAKKGKKQDEREKSKP